ncbi:hypothetical protein [Cupriavidus sp. 2MCAB6]|uniref:hypothetical protein n=1 Tax=Cupriavidus sp. 2MCAB6 TaxID=3232981 RepID=UPI003F90A88E
MRRGRYLGGVWPDLNDIRTHWRTRGGSALARDRHLKAGSNDCEGRVTYKAVATALAYEYMPADQLLD